MGVLTAELRRSTSAVAEVFRNPALRRLQMSRKSSMTGEWAYVVGLGVIAFEAGGVQAVSLAAISRMLPAAIVTPFVSSIADRYSSRTVLIVSALGRALAVGLAGVALLFELPVVSVFVCVAVASPLSTLMRPAYGTLLPSLVRSAHELTASNVATSVIESASMVTGPGLAGLLLAVDEPGLVFIASAVAFVWSALLSWRLPVTEQISTSGEQRRITESAKGVTAIKDLPHMLLLVGLYLAQTLMRGAVNVLIVVVAIQLLDMGQPGVGLLNGAIGVGGVLGAIAPLILMRNRGFGVAFLMGLALWGLPIALMGGWPVPLLAVGLMAVLGSARSISEVSGVTALQRVIPGDVLGRVLSLVEAAVTLSLALGAVLAPILVEALGTRATLVVIGLSLPSMALLSVPAMRAFDRSHGVSQLRVDLLRKVPIFWPLTIGALDYLAGRLERKVADPGEIICRQGDEGDAFFIIAWGEVEIIVDGEIVRRQGQGEYFGEIALIRDVPRTATVVATKLVTVYALHRDDFLGAIAGYSGAAVAANSIVGLRLSGVSPGVAAL